MEDWDGEGYACLNTECCTVLRNNVKISFIVTGVMAFALGILAIFLVIFACFLKSDLETYQRDDNKCDVLVIIFIILMTLFIGGFGMYTFRYAAGVPYPGDAQMAGSITDAGAVDPHLLLLEDSNSSTCFSSSFDELRFENATSCDRCTNVLYVNITATDAVL